MTPQSLPPRWQIQPLSEVVEVLDHLRRPVNSKERQSRTGGIPYYGATGQVGTIDNFLFDEDLVLLGEDGVQFFDPGKPKAYEISGKTWVNNHAHVLRCLPAMMEQKLLVHFLNQFDYRGFANGTTRLKLTQGAMNRIPVVSPPIEEQREIVRILEEQFSRLDAAAASIAAVRRKADQFRRSIWRTAFLGGLSLEGIRSESPWPLVELNQLNHPERPICYGILMPGPDVPDGIPYVKVRDMRNDVVSVDSLNRTSPEIESKYARARLKAGDVLVSIRGTYGRVAIVPQELDGGNITQDTARIAPVGCTNKYLAAYLRSPEAQAFLQRVARGVAVKGVNIGDLRRLPVPVPSTEIQQSVVQCLDKYSSVLSVVDATVVKVSERLESTRRSLLHAAFTGELTKMWREKNNG
jgi:type I restriction enzyme S subunit